MLFWSLDDISSLFAMSQAPKRGRFSTLEADIYRQHRLRAAAAPYTTADTSLCPATRTSTWARVHQAWQYAWSAALQSPR